jgi:WD40 repeat protein
MSTVAARVNPYPGLPPFEERNADVFFGRDREIEDLLERLTSRRLLAVIGVSGCGKSSLVRAGLTPILRLGAAPNLPAHWRIYTLTPGNAPLQSLRQELHQPGDWPSSSFDLVDYARAKLGPGECMLLIVDQFEELFSYRDATMDQDGGNAASLFANLLLRAVEQREVPIYVLLTMRTDFLGKCTQFRGLPEALNDCYYLVPRLTRLQQQEAIERPLQEQGQAIQPVLVQQLLNDSAEDPDHLPVLQHLLKRLWENWDGPPKPGDGPIDIDDYTQVGGWRDCLNNDADGVFRQFQANEQGIRQLFQWITDRGTGEKPVRRPRPLSECVGISGLPADRLREIIRAFQDRGLLRASDRSDKSLVDLPHESVMWQWTRLKGWIADEAEQATQLRFFLQAARQKNPLVGLSLETAVGWQLGESPSAERYLKPKEIEQAEGWVVQCVRKRQAKSRRRQWVFGAIALATLVLVAIGLWRHQAAQTTEEARRLADWTAASVNEDPERGLILGLLAWRKQSAMVPGLETSLHAAVMQSQSRLTRQENQNAVLGIAWSPDGRKLATASADQTAIWDASSGHDLLTLSGHGGLVLSIAWSPDGSKLATASNDGTATVWDASNGRELLILEGHKNKDAVWSIAWSPDGSKLATASLDKTAKIWDASSGRTLFTLRGHLDAVRSIAWSPDGKKLATASSDETTRIWDAGSGRMLSLQGHQGPLLSVAWSPDGRKLASAGIDKIAKIWDARNGRLLLSVRGHESAVVSIAWSPDGGELATASDDKTAKVWEASSGGELLTLRGHQDSIRSIAWSPDGARLATGSYDKTAKVWEAGGGRELLVLVGHQDVVRSITWSPDGSKLATASYDKTARVWDAASGRQLLTLAGHSERVGSLAWSPDGSKLATASSDMTAKVWDLGSASVLRILRGHKDRVVGLAWSPDGRKLATASLDKTAKVWDAATGRVLLTLIGHEDTVVSVAWSPDGSKLATTSSDKTAKVWDADGARVLYTLRGHADVVTGITWSPDGRNLATSSSDKTGKIWDANSGRDLFTLRGHTDKLTSIAWSPDGSKLATASFDKTAKVWEAASARELFTLRGHQDRVWGIAWSPDHGKRLASAGADGIAQVYAIDSAEFLHLVRSRITRNLTSAECDRYLNSTTCPALPDVP